MGNKRKIILSRSGKVNHHALKQLHKVRTKPVKLPELKKSDRGNNKDYMPD
jgi:hypothetical protein